MKIKELIYQTPEMSEEKLLEIIGKYQHKMLNNTILNRIRGLHKDVTINQAILNEYDLIQDKSSYLSKSQRSDIVGFVGFCMLSMVKYNNG